MSKPYRLVVFDWEGTLSDTLGQTFYYVAKEARRLNFGELDEDLARKLVDLGLNHALQRLFPHLTLKEHETLLQAVQNHHLQRLTQIHLLPGAKEFVEQLDKHGFMLAIATNKGQQGLTRALVASNLQPFFKITRTASQCTAKPATQMLEEIIEQAGVLPEETLMIGDSVTDIEMAKGCHVDAIGVSFYHQHITALLAAGAMGVFFNYPELAESLNLFQRKD
ncbi:MAG TPA: HAD family hydrolase [Legionellales bacterium]|nr:HAD family hydrolase [Legionellales bacterium]|tara:strand:- start:385 stop:1050 length:666 start_codon:yes stop_codon:yes gene_type:complete